MAKRPAKTDDAPAIPYGPRVRVALFKGEDAYLRAAYTDRLKDAVEKTGVPVEVIRFDGISAQIADVLDECRSFGLMAQHKLVVVENADQWLLEGDDDEAAGPGAPRPGGRRAPARQSKRELVEGYIKNPTDGATLVLRAQSWRPGKIDALIPGVGVIEQCDSPTPALAAAALMRRAKERLSCEISREAADYLVGRCGTNLGVLVQELEKLGALVGPGGTIETAHIKEVVGVSREEEAWDLQPALVSGSAEVAVAKVRELIEVSRVDEVMLRFAAIDLARKLHAHARGAAQGIPAGVVAKLNWVREFGLNQKVQTLGARLAPDRAARLLARSVDADAAGKTGRGQEDIDIETLVVEFVEALKS